MGRLKLATKTAGSRNCNWVRMSSRTRGVAVPVSRRGLTLERYVASARLVENALPDGANWDGRDGETPADTTASGRGGGR